MSAEQSLTSLASPERRSARGQLGEAEIRVFVDAVVHYFRQAGGDAATVRAAFLADDQASAPTSDYTGLITVSGAYVGSVYFSAPSLLLRQLLMSMKERASHDNYLDAVGEIANTIAGNARRHFTEKLEISAPVAFAGPAVDIRTAVRARPLVLTVEWRALQAIVVVDVASA